MLCSKLGRKYPFLAQCKKRCVASYTSQIYSFDYFNKFSIPNHCKLSNKTCLPVTACRSLSHQSRRDSTNRRSEHHFSTQVQPEVTEAAVSKRLIETHIKEMNDPLKCSIVGDEAAQALVKVLGKDLEENDQIVEITPGPGVLTNEILKHTNNKLLLFEPRQNLNSSLHNTFSEHIASGRVTVSQYDFLKFYTYYIYHERRHSTKAFQEFMSLFPERSDAVASNKNVKVVGAVSDKSFFPRVILSIMFDVTIYERVRPTLYLIVSNNIYTRFYHDFTHFKNLNSRYSIFSKVFLNVKKMGNVSSHSVFPTDAKRSSTETDSNWVIVKLEPNFNVLNKLNTQNKISLMYFLRIISRVNRNDPAVNVLEAFIPSFAETLALANMKPLSRISDLTLNEILYMYYLFIGHPKFKESGFMKAAEKKSRHLKGLLNFR